MSNIYIIKTIIWYYIGYGYMVSIVNIFSISTKRIKFDFISCSPLKIWIAEIQSVWHIKVGCVFLMVIWSEFRMEQYRDDGHRDDTPHFNLPVLKLTLDTVQCSCSNLVNLTSFLFGLFGFDLGLRIRIFDSLLIILPTSLSEQ